MAVEGQDTVAIMLAGVFDWMLQAESNYIVLRKSIPANFLKTLYPISRDQRPEKADSMDEYLFRLLMYVALSASRDTTSGAVLD
jgi:hypothetical protein